MQALAWDLPEAQEYIKDDTNQDTPTYKEYMDLTVEEREIIIKPGQKLLGNSLIDLTSSNNSWTSVPTGNLSKRPFPSDSQDTDPHNKKKQEVTPSIHEIQGEAIDQDQESENPLDDERPETNTETSLVVSGGAPHQVLEKFQQMVLNSGIKKKLQGSCKITINDFDSSQAVLNLAMEIAAADRPSLVHENLF